MLTADPADRLTTRQRENFDSLEMDPDPGPARIGPKTNLTLANRSQILILTRLMSREKGGAPEEGKGNPKRRQRQEMKEKEEETEGEEGGREDQT